jgi:hypothetical protein
VWEPRLENGKFIPGSLELLPNGWSPHHLLTNFPRYKHPLAGRDLMFGFFQLLNSPALTHNHSFLVAHLTP